ncbi:MAG TPA: PIN domain-containing protein [Bryobacterales bacterium]|nr:PIN domain-containing protein [Bryobacterales bacterium]
MSVAYLDTHVVVWLSSGDVSRLSDTARRVIEESDLLISPAVLLELKFLQEIRRIKSSPSRIQSYLARRVGLRVSDKAFEEVVLAAAKLSWVRDPFDRLIVGHAAAGGDLLVTKDSRILERYSNAVW